MERLKARPKEALPPTQYLSFFIAGEEYAVGILRVKEILEFGNLTRIPTTPVWIRGIINLRGAGVPVVDLAVKLGLPETPVTKRTCVVILETQLEKTARTMGIMVDSVSQVMDLLPGEIEPPPTFGARLRVDFLLGMGKVDSKFVLLLDIDRILSPSEVLQTAGLVDEAHCTASNGGNVRPDGSRGV
jgi:purine-binding chemotaxis protein CheW